MPQIYLLEKFDSGMHFILLDEKTVLALTKNNNKRVICKLNDLVEFHCAIMPKKEGGHYINIGSVICKKIKAKVGAELTATFIADSTAYQFEMPEEFTEVLETDLEANKIFHSLSAGNQRGLIYLVTQPKSSEKKIVRALKIAERIKGGITSPRLVLK